jgi:hypothetical protein
MESAGSVDTTSPSHPLAKPNRTHTRSSSEIAYRCQRCGRRGSRYNPLQANDLSYAVYNATGRTPIYDLETLCGAPATKRGDGSQTGYRRANNLLVWVIIIAALLAYAILHG